MATWTTGQKTLLTADGSVRHLVLRASSAKMPAFLIVIGLVSAVASADDRKASQTSEKSAKVARSKQTDLVSSPIAAPSPGTVLFQFDMQRTGFLRNGKSLPKQPKVIWKYTPEPIVPATGQILGSTGGIAPGTPVVANGVIYFGDDGGRLNAVNASDGRKKWIYNHGPHPIWKAPCIVDGRLYFTSAGNVECLDCENGRLNWSRDLLQGAAECSPLVVGESVYVASPDGFVYAFNRENGDTIWRASLVSDVTPDPKGFDSKRARGSATEARPVSSASDGKTLFQSVFDQSRVVSLDCKTGQFGWSFQARGWIYDHPAVSEKYVFVGSQDDHLHCLERTTGKPVWKLPAGSRIEAGAAIANGRVYFVACNGRVFSAEANSGKQVWMFQTEPDSDGTRAIYCAPLVTDETVYIAAMDGQLYALDVRTGEERWAIRASTDSEIASHSLATDGRRIFVSTRPTIKKRGEYAVFAIGD